MTSIQVTFGTKHNGEVGYVRLEQGGGGHGFHLFSHVGYECSVLWKDSFSFCLTAVFMFRVGLKMVVIFVSRLLSLQSVFERVVFILSRRRVSFSGGVVVWVHVFGPSSIWHIGYARLEQGGSAHGFSFVFSRWL